MDAPQRHLGVHAYQYVKSVTVDGEVRKNMRAMPTPDWRVHLPDHHEGYITVEEFEQNRQRLARNRTNGEGTVLSGAAREGLALLQGLLMCGAAAVHLRCDIGVTGAFI